MLLHYLPSSQKIPENLYSVTNVESFGRSPDSWRITPRIFFSTEIPNQVFQKDIFVKDLLDITWTYVVDFFVSRAVTFCISEAFFLQIISDMLVHGVGKDMGGTKFLGEIISLNPF